MNGRQARWRRVVRTFGSVVRPNRPRWHREPGSSKVIVRDGRAVTRWHPGKSGGRR